MTFAAPLPPAYRAAALLRLGLQALGLPHGAVARVERDHALVLMGCGGGTELAGTTWGTVGTALHASAGSAPPEQPLALPWHNGATVWTGGLNDRDGVRLAVLWWTHEPEGPLPVVEDGLVRSLAEAVADAVTAVLRGDDGRGQGDRGPGPARGPDRLAPAVARDPQPDPLAQRPRSRLGQADVGTVKAQVAELRDYLDPETMAEFVRTFQRGAEASADAIAVSLALREWPALASAAHRLKGSCAQLGATELASACERLEAAAKSGDRMLVELHLERVKIGVEALTSVDLLQ